MGIYWKDGYSAEVEVYLDVGGERYAVERIGKSGLILRDDCSLPAGTLGKLVMVVDGDVRNVDILLSRDCVAGNRQPVPFF
jgi:hypothetical protein